MKFSKRFTVRAALVIAAGGVIGALGACKKDDGVGPTPPPPPPPPPSIPAPSGLTATAGTGNRIDLTWTDNSTNETGFRVDRCSGAGCSSFAQVGTNTAANITVFADENGLTAATSYSYRVRAFNATDSSTWSSTATAITGSPPVQGVVMIGAGEITSCGSPGAPQTATLIQNQVTADPNTIVFTIGNNLADTSAVASYATCFDPTWGKFKAAMRPAVGNFDYESVGREAIYSYFGDRLPANGWYAFDAGTTWRVIVLNTSTWEHGATGMTGPHPQFDFLNNELAANTKPCVMVISWERRLYTATSGAMSKNQNMDHIAQAMYAAGADILLSANQKQYMRFPKTNVDGAPDAAGFAQFVVGTGGRSLDRMHAPLAGNPVAAQFGGIDGTPNSWGVVKFTLNANSYKWEFVGTNPAAFSDSGEQACN